jgi:hypothetical protein
MGDDFELGKELVIEGVDGVIKLYEPFLKLIHGLNILGIGAVLQREETLLGDKQEYDALRLVLDTWMQEFKNAKTKEEVQQTIDNAREFIKRLF